MASICDGYVFPRQPMQLTQAPSASDLHYTTTTTTTSFSHTRSQLAFSEPKFGNSVGLVSCTSLGSPVVILSAHIMFLDWAFKPRTLNNDFLSFLTSKTAVTCMALIIAPPVLWLTFTWADRAAADSTDKMSTESVSSIYPDRPIRPLPKRRMRDRLSSEELDTIRYPPAPQNNVPLFDYPYNLKAEAGEGRGEASNVVGRENTAELAQESSLRRSGLGGGGSSSNEHGEKRLLDQARRATVSHSLDASLGYAIRTPPRQSRHTIPQPPPSTASSADGYDSFENTNNKKKRKIPTAGESMLNGSHVLSDPSIMGMPSPPTTGDEGPGDSTLATPHAYYQSGPGNANAQGFSGPGRGRYGRNRNGRSPMRTIPDINVGLPKNPKLKSGGQYPGSPAGMCTLSLHGFEPVANPLHCKVMFCFGHVRMLLDGVCLCPSLCCAQMAPRRFVPPLRAFKLHCTAGLQCPP